MLFKIGGAYAKNITIIVFVYKYSVGASTYVFAQSNETLYKNQSQMELALSGVQNIDQLLNDKSKLDQYYAAVNDYYQGKINRDIFDIIIKQIKKMAKANPEFGARLLEEQKDLKTYSITSDFKTYGRELEVNAWDKLERKIFGSSEVSGKYIVKSQEKLAELSNEIINFENSLLQLNKREAGLKRAEFYSKFKKDNEALFKKIAASIYYNNEQIREMAETQDADMILFIFDSGLKEVIKKSNIPENLKSIVMGSLPKVSELLSYNTVFPVETELNHHGVEVPVEPLQATTYRFIPFKRKIHAVWKGIWLSECVGGGNSSPTPRRWATSVLKNVNNYAVEKNNSFVGFIQELGMKKNGSNAIYYSTEFGVPNLKESTIVVDKETGMPTKVPMIDQWLRAAPRNILRIKSESYAINNAKVVGALESSAAWNFRIDKGAADEFKLVDDSFAQKIVSMSKKYDFEPSHEYGDGIISDGTVPDAASMKTLTYAKWSINSLERFLTRDQVVAENFTDMESQHPDLYAKVNFNTVIKNIFDKKRKQSTAVFLEILEKVRNKVDNPEYYINELINSEDTDAYSKLVLIGEHLELQDAVNYLNTVKLDDDFMQKVESNDDFYYAMTKAVRSTLKDRIIKEKIVSLFYFLIEHRDKYLTQEKDLSAVVKLILETTDLSQKDKKEIIRVMASFAMENITPSLRSKIYEFTKKLKMDNQFRKHLKDENISLFKNFTMDVFLIEIAKDAVAAKEYSVLVEICNGEMWHVHPEKVNSLNKLFTALLDSQDEKMMKMVLSSESLGSFLRAVRSPTQQLSPSLQIVRKKMSELNQNFYNKIDLATYVSASRQQQDHAIGGHVNGTQRTQTENNQVQTHQNQMHVETTLEIRLRELFDTNDAQEINSLQSDIEKEIKRTGLTVQAHQMIINFLDSKSGRNKWASSSFAILALLEISASLQDAVPYDVYELSKKLAEKVLNQQEYR